MNETNRVAWKRLSVEAAAIVGSILLAFAIDAWWEDRNEIELERRQLTAVLAEFEQNAELLRQARTQYEQRYLDALRVLKYMRDGATDLDSTELEESFRGLIIGGTFHLESGAHDGLLASGELNLIRDEELRNRLAAWPSYVKEWSEEQDSVFFYVREVLVPYLSDSVRIQNVQRRFLPFPDGEPPPQIPAGAGDVASLVELSTSVKFENLVYLRAQGLWYAMRDGETLLAQTTAIAELIRHNLEM
jgi:hypothetical protein